MLHLKHGHYQVPVSHGCQATEQLWKLDFVYILYSSVGRQQGAHLTHAFLKILFENIEYIL